MSFLHHVVAGLDGAGLAMSLLGAAIAALGASFAAFDVFLIATRLTNTSAQIDRLARGISRHTWALRIGYRGETPFSHRHVAH